MVDVEHRRPDGMQSPLVRKIGALLPVSDEERDAILESRGRRILRFSNEEVGMDIRSVLARILEATRQTELPFPHREGAGG